MLMYLLERHARDVTIKASVKQRQNQGGDIGKRLVVAGVFGRLAVPVLVATLPHGSWANRWLPRGWGDGFMVWRKTCRSKPRC